MILQTLLNTVYIYIYIIMFLPIPLPIPLLLPEHLPFLPIPAS